jgi:hypothetical protein
MDVVAGSHGNAAAVAAADAAAGRRRKTAAERRAQRARAQARAVSHLLAGFDEVAAHRGNAVSKTASIFSRALRCLKSGGWVLHEKTGAPVLSSAASSFSGVAERAKRAGRAAAPAGLPAEESGCAADVLKGFRSVSFEDEDGLPKVAEAMSDLLDDKANGKAGVLGGKAEEAVPWAASPRSSATGAVSTRAVVGAQEFVEKGLLDGAAGEVVSAAVSSSCAASSTIASSAGVSGQEVLEKEEVVAVPKVRPTMAESSKKVEVVAEFEVPLVTKTSVPSAAAARTSTSSSSAASADGKFVQETGREGMKRVATAPSMSYVRVPGDELEKTAASSSVSPAGGSAVLKKGKSCVESVAEVIPKPKIVPGVTTGGNNDEMAAAASPSEASSSTAAASSLPSPGKSFIKQFDDVRVSMVDKKVEQDATAAADEAAVELRKAARRKAGAMSDAKRMVAATSPSSWSSPDGLGYLAGLFDVLDISLDLGLADEASGASKLQDRRRLQVAVQEAIFRYDELTPSSRFAEVELRAIRGVIQGEQDTGVMDYSKLLNCLRSADRDRWAWHRRVEALRISVCD